jgi:hypothetical protein
MLTGGHLRIAHQGRCARKRPLGWAVEVRDAQRDSHAHATSQAPDVADSPTAHTAIATGGLTGLLGGIPVGVLA